jgi:hypothetical protein
MIGVSDGVLNIPTMGAPTNIHDWPPCEVIRKKTATLIVSEERVAKTTYDSAFTRKLRADHSARGSTCSGIRW